jgi:hypothetical protein
MDQLSWERHLMRHKEMLRKAEAMQVCQIVVEANQRRRRLKFVRLFDSLWVWLLNHRLRRYNQPLEPRAREHAPSIPHYDHY